MGLDPKEIAITMLLVSILFHYFSYSFTITAIDYSDYELSIDIIDLYASGIMLGEYDEHNISFQTDPYPWTEFEVGNSTMRFLWRDFIFVGDSIGSQIQAKFFGFDSWINFDWRDIPGGRHIRNATIIEWWDSENNWTMFHGLTGYVLFITDPLKQGNITRAVQVDGNLTLTLAQNVAWSETPGVSSFINWYFGLVTGSESFGLPDNFAIIVRIMTLLGMFAGIFLLSELRRIVI